ncbi:MAG: hypothetical protein LBR30_00240 [Clostridioides sp.]|nr:hypothetical protein [Clostridioides sp.]
MKERKNYEKRRNVTLVELVVSISIVVLIATICIPKEKNNYRQLNLLARQLTTDIKYVRRKNMLGDYNTYITFVKKNGISSYILTEEGKSREIIFPKGIVTKSGDVVLKFNKDGKFSNNYSIIRVEKGSYSREITITPISGRVLLKEDLYEE